MQIKSMGDRIKEIRGDLTKADFAKELGITPDYVRMIETNEKTPSPTLIKLICIKYNITEEWLFHEKEPKFQKNPKITKLMDKIEFIYEKGRDKDKNYVRGVIEEIYDEISEAVRIARAKQRTAG